MHSFDTAVGTRLVGRRVEEYLGGGDEAQFHVAEAGLEFLVLLPLLCCYYRRVLLCLASFCKGRMVVGVYD